VKNCEWCNRDLPLEDFSRQVGGEQGRQGACKDCHAYNMRENHNIAMAPPRPRRSPYDNMAEVLRDIETAMTIGPNTVQATIDEARVKYSL